MDCLLLGPEVDTGEGASVVLTPGGEAGEKDDRTAPFARESEVEAGGRPSGNLLRLFRCFRDGAERCFLRELCDVFCCSFFSKALWAAVNAQILKLNTC